MKDKDQSEAVEDVASRLIIKGCLFRGIKPYQIPYCFIFTSVKNLYFFFFVTFATIKNL